MTATRRRIKPLAAGTPSRFGRGPGGRLALIAILGLIGLSVWAKAQWSQSLLREAYLPQLETRARQLPSDGRLLALLGARQAQAHDPDCVQTLTQAIANGERDPSVPIALAWIYASIGNNDQALATLRTGQQAQNGATSEIDKALSRVEDVPASADPSQWATAVEPEGPQALVADVARPGALDGLEQWWGRRHPEQSGFATREQWAKDEPNDAEVQRLWGLALLLNQRVLEATDVLQKAEQLAPNSAAIHIAIAQALEAGGDDQRALDAYAETLKLDPNSVQALIGVGRISLDRRSLDARAAFLKATALAPTSVPAWIGLGRADQLEEDFQAESLHAFETAANLAPDRTDYLADYSQSLVDNGRYDDAEAVVRKYIVTAPTDEAGHYQLGHILLLNNPTPARLAEALSETLKADGLAQHSAPIDQQLGEIRLRLGNADDAIRSLQNAVADDPRDFRAMRILARAYGSAGRTDLSIQMSARAEGLYQAQMKREQLARKTRVEQPDALAQLIGSLPAAVTTAASTSAASTPLRFVDVAQAAGLNYQCSVPGARPHNILQGIGYGCAFLDWNNDGNLDILLIGPTLALYQGNGKGHFTDVTQAAGLSGLKGVFQGCAVGDYDNDGYEDIYLSAYGGGVLLHNEQGKRFRDVTAASGLKPQPWGTSCAFVDLDNDGKLDLYVANYVDFGLKTVPQLCTVGGMQGVCPPTMYAPIKGSAFRNSGGGKFEDVTNQWNAQAASGKCLGVAFADFDGSGHQSLALANDEMAANLLKNDGHRFTDVGSRSGVAYSVNGNVDGGMGVDWGDYDNDGRLDLAVATFAREAKCVYHNDGSGSFTEMSSRLGLAVPTLPNVAFGEKWLDVDNDGFLDLMIANGHVRDNVNDVDKTATYRQPTQLFHNEGGVRFSDASAGLTGDAAGPIVGRGLAIGDFDNDGKVDALVVDAEGHPLLLHNETPNAGHWLEINLVGTRCNRDGLGALVTVTAGGRSLLRLCTTSGSYLSASDKRVHFGLGASTTADTVVVQWPDGRKDTWPSVHTDQIVTLREGNTH